MKPKRLIYGIGVNDADYIVVKREELGYVDGKRKQKTVWKCSYYQTWAEMIRRCYDAKYQERHPTYASCTVSEDWHTFSRFREWMELQDFEGLQLDKDILIKGNKLYSPETCVFVTPMVNSFANDQAAKRGEWMIGAIWHKQSKKFRANCSNPFTKKQEYLGLFTSEQQAHNAWLKHKNELAHELAEIQTDERVAKALISRYTRTS